MKKQRQWVCNFLNSKYEQKQRVFKDLDEGLDFTRKLDERIEKGTCFGYDFYSISI